MASMLQKVRKGAKLLDKKTPNWFKKVKVKSLDMSEPSQCILVQVYGTYGAACTALGLDDRKDGTVEELVDGHGFDTEGDEAVYDQLTDKWLVEVNTRKIALKERKAQLASAPND